MALCVKICGLSTPEAVDAAIEAGADLLGFVFFPPSPRHITYDQAHALSQHIGQRAEKVALSVDADLKTLSAMIDALRPGMLQLHGNEKPGQVEHIAEQFRLPVMKAIPVATRADLARIPDYAPVVDWLLFDAHAPKDATRPGGLGAAFDWHLLDGLSIDVPFMLSGGLTIDNLEEALAIAKPSGLDVSSGVETRPGLKDPDKIHAFVAAARNAENKMQKAAQVAP